MMVLVCENHEKCPNVTPVQHFCSGFDHASLVSSFRGFKYLPKLDSVMCFLEYEHLKRFVWKDDNIFVFKRKIGNQAHFPIWQ